MDWKAYVKKLQVSAPQIFRFGWVSWIADPLPHMRIFMTGNANNYSGWSHREYDQIVEKIERLKPGPERESLLQRAQKILLEEEAVVVPLFHYVQNSAVSSRVHGFKMNPFGVMNLAELTLE
jgi:ABC-type oligopeptide transport system substrate-binding subunit